MRSRAQRIIDLTRVLAKYSDRWVALSRDERRVIASGKTPREALTHAHTKGEKDPILMWAPKEHGAYIL